MTLREFEHGYWYRDQLTEFAARIGIPAAAKRKDELEKAIEVFLRTGTAALPTVSWVKARAAANVRRVRR